MTALLVFLIIFIAVFVQTLVGFGSAMIAMGLLASVVGLHIAAPLFALVATLFEAVLVVYYRESIQVKAVARIAIATVLGIPIGLFVLTSIPERVTLAILGATILGYALYSLRTMKPPNLRSPAWAYVLGGLAGMLGGAYNITGPPIILYGNSQGWTPKIFKANLQSYFVITTLMLVISHMLAGNYTPDVTQYIGVAAVAAGAGVVAGVLLEKRVSPQAFGKGVLWVLAILGLRLIFG